jgi:tetratricopeptide (TPR) repeat protein
MSLLLDALKKNGGSPSSDTHENARDRLAEMSLEELPGKPAATAAAPSSLPPQASPRSTGENLFAAKKPPALRKFQYNLGIIPTAIIIGLVLSTAGGIYVWMEIQPPNVAQYRAPANVVASNTAPLPRAAPPLALPPEKFRETEKPAKIQRPVPDTEVRTKSTFTRSANSRLTSPPMSDTGIQIQRKYENDGIFTTLTAGYQAYQSGDYGTAWQRYREVLQKDPKNRDALLGMAAIAQQQGQDESAIQSYKQVLTLDPRDPVALAGLSAFSTGDSASKESRLKSSIAQTPQSAALYYALGNLYNEQSRWGDAQQAFASGLKIEPANALLSFSLATSLDHLGRGKLAAQYYQQALQLDTSGNSGFDRVQTEQRMKQLQGR